MRTTGLLNKNYSTSGMDQNIEPPQNPLNLLRDSCERLLNECAHRNRKSLKFRFIDLNTTTVNYNLQPTNILRNHYNEMNNNNNNITTCHSNNNNNNNNNKYNTPNQTIFQCNPNIPLDEEILDYSMNHQMKSCHSSSSSISSPIGSLSTDASSSTSSNCTFNNSPPNFPYSCFTSSTLNIDNNSNNNNNNNLPLHSMSDMIQILLHQKLIDPSLGHTLQQQQQQYLSNFPHYKLNNDHQEIQTKHNTSYLDNYYEYLKLLTNFINYFSLLNNLTTDSSNTTDNLLNISSISSSSSSSTDVNMANNDKRSV